MTDSSIDPDFAEAIQILRESFSSEHAENGHMMIAVKYGIERGRELERSLGILRHPTPEMIAAAWDVIDRAKLAGGIRRLGPGVGIAEIWQAMAAVTPDCRVEAGRLPPLEPTEAMVEAGLSTGNRFGKAAIARIWKLMYRAAYPTEGAAS